MNKSDKETLNKILIDLKAIEGTIEQEITYLVQEIIKGGSKIEPTLNTRMFKLTEVQARIKVIIERLNNKGE